MAKITITTLHDGLNVKDDAKAISDGASTECVGFDLSKEGVLSVATGQAAHDLGSYVPSEDVQWLQIVTMNDVRYYLITTESGLYSNGVLVDATFTGEFKADVLGSNIYLVNGTYAKRFNGTTVYQWGITAPTVAPTITAVANDYKDIETFNVTTDWVANAASATVAQETTITKEGGSSLKVTVSASTTGYTFDSYSPALDLNDLNGRTVDDNDYISLWFYCNDMENLDSVMVEFDCGNGLFTSDYYSYYMPCDGEVSQSKNFGAWEDVVITTGQWALLKIPKGSFARYGTAVTDWSTIFAMRVKVSANSVGQVICYFDQCRLMGGGYLDGEYEFAYGWGRLVDGEVVHYSKPIMVDGVISTQGPLSFNRQQLAYGVRAASSDAQVDCCVIYILGGTVTTWTVYHVITDNGTGNGVVDVDDTELTQVMISQYNDEAPTGTQFVYWGGRFWMTGFGDASLRCSEIASDGTLMPEAWPATNNAWTIQGETDLFHVSVLAKQLIVGGRYTVNVVGMSDITDVTSVAFNPVGEYGMLGSNAYLKLDDAYIFPSDRLFVEFTPAGARPILNQASPIILIGGMANAVGVSVGLVNYFSFKDVYNIWRTAKLDRFRGEPRIYFQNYSRYNSLVWDRDRERIYGVQNGSLYCLENGYTDAGASLDAAITTKEYLGETCCVWENLVFMHNTGGNYFEVSAIVDGRTAATMSFSSTKKEKSNFKFGPVDGYACQIRFSGVYNSAAEIYLPMELFYT